MNEQLSFTANTARRELADGAWVDFVRGFVPEDEARELHAALVRELAWENREIVLFGKRIPQPRLIAWAGNFGYRYSGQTLEPRDATPALAAVIARVVLATSVPFNHALVNRYRDGNDSMGMHADAEPELGKNPVVASLSFGAARRFVLARRAAKGTKSERFEYELGQGDLLVMGGSCQCHYRHGVPKSPGFLGERVSVTLRRVLTAPGGTRLNP